MRFPERDRGRSPFEEFSDYSGAVERGDGCWTVAEASSRGEADLDLSSRLCFDRLIYDVCLDRPLCVAAEMEVVDQTLAPGGHGILSGREDRI